MANPLIGVDHHIAISASCQRRSISVRYPAAGGAALRSPGMLGYGRERAASDRLVDGIQQRRARERLGQSRPPELAGPA
jgi:hypothetical protein